VTSSGANRVFEGSRKSVSTHSSCETVPTLPERKFSKGFFRRGKKEGTRNLSKKAIPKNGCHWKARRRKQRHFGNRSVRTIKGPLFWRVAPLMVEGGPREEKKGFLPSWRKEQHSHVSAVVRGRKQVKGGLNEDGTTFVNEGRCSWNPKQQQTAFSVCVFLPRKLTPRDLRRSRCREKHVVRLQELCRQTA